jgi:hypothetical protein
MGLQNLRVRAAKKRHGGSTLSGVMGTGSQYPSKFTTTEVGEDTITEGLFTERAPRRDPSRNLIGNGYYDALSK